MTKQVSGFEIVAAGVNSPVIIHVPHSGLIMPDKVQRSLLPNSTEIAEEISLMADLHTDLLAHKARQHCPAPPAIFQNTLSRLVIDPERFDDESEEMNQVGMGVVYTKTSDGKPLRESDRATEKFLKDTFYYPYHEAFEKLVDETLSRFNFCVILDLHSYRKEALPYELHKAELRPEVCLGVDSFHTPDWLINQSEIAFSDMGEVVVNQPFHGTFVPTKHFQQDSRVSSIMLEIRKDTYLDETSKQLRSDERVSASLTNLVNSIEMP